MNQRASGDEAKLLQLPGATQCQKPRAVRRAARVTWTCLGTTGTGSASAVARLTGHWDLQSWGDAPVSDGENGLNKLRSLCPALM